MRAAVLDANVLYGAFGRDVPPRLGADGPCRPRWTARIEAERTGAPLAARPDLTPAQVARTCAAMARAFPDAAVEGYERHEAGLALPDPDDRHVLAAAVEAGAGEVVTWELGGGAVSPDAFVAPMVEADPEGVGVVLEEHRAGLRRPPLTAEEYAGHLVRSGLRSAAALFRTRT